MNRQQALALLREILEATNQKDVNAICLNQESPDCFSLKINVQADEQVRNNINPILAREKLTMKQESGVLIICSTEA